MKARRLSLRCKVEGSGIRDIRSSSIIPKAVAFSSAMVSCKDARPNAYCRSAVENPLRSIRYVPTLTRPSLAEIVTSSTSIDGK